jgi:hypothetical protein
VPYLYHLTHARALRCHDKGKPTERWGRKATGLYEKKRGSRATERRWGHKP